MAQYGSTPPPPPPADIELDYILLLTNKSVPISSPFYTILWINLLKSMKFFVKGNKRQVQGELGKGYARLIGLSQPRIQPMILVLLVTSGCIYTRSVWFSSIWYKMDHCREWTHLVPDRRTAPKRICKAYLYQFHTCSKLIRSRVTASLDIVMCDARCMLTDIKSIAQPSIITTKRIQVLVETNHLSHQEQQYDQALRPVQQWTAAKLIRVSFHLTIRFSMQLVKCFPVGVTWIMLI